MSQGVVILPQTQQEGLCEQRAEVKQASVGDAPVCLCYSCTTAALGQSLI